jgi:hypothetical protein
VKLLCLLPQPRFNPTAAEGRKLIFIFYFLGKSLERLSPQVGHKYFQIFFKWINVRKQHIIGQCIGSRSGSSFDCHLYPDPYSKCGSGSRRSKKIEIEGEKNSKISIKNTLNTLAVA